MKPNPFHEFISRELSNNPFAARPGIVVRYSPASDRHPTARWIANCKNSSGRFWESVPSEDGPAAAAEKMRKRVAFADDARCLPLTASIDGGNTYAYVLSWDKDEAIALQNCQKVPDALLVIDDLASYAGRESELTPEKIQYLVGIAASASKRSFSCRTPRKPVINGWILEELSSNQSKVTLVDHAENKLFSLCDVSPNCAIASSIAAGWPVSEALRFSTKNLESTETSEQAIARAREAFYWSGW